MAERNPVAPQLDFPQLVADIIADLRLTGRVGLLDFSDQVVPIYIVGARPGGAVFQQQPVLFETGDFFAGSANAPAVNAILVDTGALPAGDYDVFGMISRHGNTAAGSATVQMQIRDAANAVTLAIPMQVAMTNVVTDQQQTCPIFGVTLAANERIRFQVITNGLTGQISSNIWAKRRPAL